MGKTILALTTDETRQELSSHLAYSDELDVIYCHPNGEFLHSLRAHKPDIFLVDLHGTALNELAYIRLLRTDPENARLPIIACSPKRAQSGLLATHLSAQGIFHLSYPYSHEEITKTISLALTATSSLQ